MSRWISLGALVTVVTLGTLYIRTATLVSSMHEHEQHSQMLQVHPYESTTYHSSSRRKIIRQVRRNKQNPLEIVEERLVEREPERESVGAAKAKQQVEEEQDDLPTNNKQVPPPPKVKHATTRSSTTKITTTLQLDNNDGSNPATVWPPPHLTNASMVILVLSARAHVELRQAIRETWGSGHDNVYFVIGQYCPINTSGRKHELTCEDMPRDDQNSNPSHHDEWYQKRMTLETTILMQEQEHYRDMLWTPSPESYRGLPHKLKEGYHWVVSNLPNAQWIVKADDDMVVRVGALGTYLTTTMSDYCDYRQPTIIGKIEYEGFVHKTGKWLEEKYPHSMYPPFPLGSCGHVVSRPVAEYISTHKDTLVEYQGEDTSLAIWMNESPLQPDLQILHSKAFENNAACENPNHLIIGHDLSIAKIRQCYKTGDEVQPIARYNWRQEKKEK